LFILVIIIIIIVIIIIIIIIIIIVFCNIDSTGWCYCMINTFWRVPPWKSMFTADYYYSDWGCLVEKLLACRDGPWPDPTWAYFWPAVNKRQTHLWPGYFLTQPEEIFFDLKGKKLKNLIFWGEIFQIQTQTKNGWPDTTQSTKNWPDPTRVNNFWPRPITTAMVCWRLNPQP